MKEKQKDTYIEYLKECLNINVGDTIYFCDKLGQEYCYILKKTYDGYYDLFNDQGRCRFDLEGKTLDSFCKHFYLDFLLDIFHNLKIEKTGKEEQDKKINFFVATSNNLGGIAK